MRIYTLLIEYIIGVQPSIKNKTHKLDFRHKHAKPAMLSQSKKNAKDERQQAEDKQEEYCILDFSSLLTTIFCEQDDRARNQTNVND